MLFDELIFNPHPIVPNGTQAIIKFENGYGASVITGNTFYTDPEHPYELAVLKQDRLAYGTGITDDVIGHLNKIEVNTYLEKIKAL